MAGVTSAGIVGAARAAGSAAVAFNVIGIEHAEAIVTGAEQADRPVILQLSENCVDYHGALAPIGRALLTAADAATVPVAVHLDHATRERLVRAAAKRAKKLGLKTDLRSAIRLIHERRKTRRSA